MKVIKSAILSIVLLALAFTKTMAQDDINQFLQQSVKDGEKLIGAYVSPAMKSISSGLNQGWYNTAKPHKIAGFDLTFTVNMMKIPTNQFQYKPANLNLEKIELAPSSPGQPNAPTIFGNKNE